MAHAYTRTHTCMHARTHARTHAHTHTHTQSPQSLVGLGPHHLACPVVLTSRFHPWLSSAILCPLSAIHLCPFKIYCASIFRLVFFFSFYHPLLFSMLSYSVITLTARIHQFTKNPVNKLTYGPCNLLLFKTLVVLIL